MLAAASRLFSSVAVKASSFSSCSSTAGNGTGRDGILGGRLDVTFCAWTHEFGGALRQALRAHVESFTAINQFVGIIIHGPKFHQIDDAPFQLAKDRSIGWNRGSACWTLELRQARRQPSDEHHLVSRVPNASQSVQAEPSGGGVMGLAPPKQTLTATEPFLRPAANLKPPSTLESLPRTSAKRGARKDSISSSEDTDGVACNVRPGPGTWPRNARVPKRETISDG